MARIDGDGGGGSAETDDDGQDDDFDAGGFGEELGGDPAGDADREASTGDADDGGDGGGGRLDAGGFGEELGGDPAGDADRDVSPPSDAPDDPGPRPGGDRTPRPRPDDRGPEGRLDAGGFGEELGGDPAGDADRETPDDLDLSGAPEQIEARPPRGLEADADPDATTAVSRRELLETEEVSQFLEETGLRPGEIQFNLEGGIGTGRKRFSIEVTEAGRRRLEEEARAEAASTISGRVSRGRTSRQGERALPAGALVGATADADIGADDIVRTDSGFQLTEEARDRIGESLRESQREFFGIEVDQNGASRRVSADEAAAEERAEADLERQVGAARASALGITNSRLRQAVVESTELEAGEDFTIDQRTVETDEGVRRVLDVELTDEFRREFSEDVIETRLERATGVDLEPGRDFNTVIDEETGQAVPVLTDRGRGRIALSDLDRTVEDIEAGRIPIFTDVTGVRGPRVDLVGGEGPVAPEAGSTDALESDIDILQEAEEAIGGAAAGARASIDEGRGTLRSPYTGERFLFSDQLEAGAAGLLKGAVSLGEAATTLPIRGAGAVSAGFGAVGEDIRAGGFGDEDATAVPEFTRQAGTAAGRAPFVAASGLIGEARERPIELLGALGGSLGVSAAAMRLLPSSRFVIQPGEEAAGFAGNRLTRSVAGERRAQQLFPDNEPLIFSEEFAIRQARRLRGRLEGRTEAEAGPRTTDPDLPGERPQLLTAEAVDEARGVSGPSTTRLAVGRARRRAESARTGVEDFLDRVGVRSRVGAGPFGAVEVEVEAAEPEPEFRDFEEAGSFEDVRQDSLTQAQDQLRDQARREFETRREEAERLAGPERDPVVGAETRRELAQRAEVGDVEAAVEGASIRAEVAQTPALGYPETALGLLTATAQDQREIGRLDIGSEADLVLETEIESLFESFRDVSDLETDLELEAEGESEVESLEIEAEAEAEAETEAEIEAELRSEVALEAEADDDPSGGRRREGPLAPEDLGIGMTTEGDLVPGFVSETIADIALVGGRSGRAPPRDVLEEIVETGAAPAEELPTFEEILGTPEERAAIEETREFFGLGRDIDL